MKYKRSTVIPAILSVYLLIMAAIGWPRYASGEESALFYFGVLGVTVVVIVLLHFNLKRQEKLRRKRIDETNSDNKNKTQA